MLKKLLVFFLLFLASLAIFPKQALADAEFSSNYNVSYDVDSSGVTTVIERISITHLDDLSYIKSFSLSIGATKVSEVSASDDGGPLSVGADTSGNRTNIKVSFDQQIAGKGKAQKFTITFKSLDFAQAQGKIWQVSLPKVPTANSSMILNNFNLTLSVPTSFGDPSSILPQPISTSEQDGRINLMFDKDQLSQSGILANFGSNQLFDFNLTYHINNPAILPALVSVPLPPDTAYQEVVIKSLSPAPGNVTVDEDGNYIAWFKVDRKSLMSITASGTVKLYSEPQKGSRQYLSPLQQTGLTASRKYWEADNPLVKARLSEIFKNGEPSSVKDRAGLINQYVVDTLKYDDSRLSGVGFNRYDSVTILNNPDQSLCGEFTDLFIALARADGIPARMLEGYAYTSNTSIRPLSFGGTILHAWPEYYDPNRGWVMIDPTWQNTSGGVDYFSKFDLNHLVLDIRGYSSTNPSTADDVKVSFSNTDFSPRTDLRIGFDVPEQIFAGFPFDAKVTLLNDGNYALMPSSLSLTAGSILVTNASNFPVPILPPFGHLDYKFNLRTRDLLETSSDVLELKVGSQKLDRAVLVRPFFAFNFFPLLVVVIICSMAILYMLTLWIHLKKSQSKPVQK